MASSREAVTALIEIAELHSPIVPPEGMYLLGSEPGQEYCEECTPDDPYYAVEWPCATRLLAEGGFE